MNRFNQTAGAIVSSATANWNFADGSGDHNGDGRSDILWRSDDGTVYTWLMDDAAATEALLSEPISADWIIQV